ncbi:MAG: hypothetical protein AAGF83_22345 [Cyanobacteria bacterium P01_G01_bin.67]
MDIKQERKLAKDETTSSEILANLAKSEDIQTRKYVANNPNTPIEILLKICFEFPQEVIENPIITLLILENPDSLTCKTPLDFLWNFNKIKQLTDIEIKRLGWTKVQGGNYLMKKYGKRSRLHLTDDQLLGFLTDLRKINSAKINTDIKQDRQLAQDETTSSKVLANLAKSKDYQTRKYIASNPNTPVETLLNICFEFPREVINNSRIPLLVLENSDLLTCKIPIDFNEIKRLTDIEIKRLGWTISQCRNHLMKHYGGKRSRLHLSDNQFLDYLADLRKIK